MALSYPLRLACLIAVSVGLLQTMFELLLWVAAPVILRLLRALPLRRQERLLYGIQLAPTFFAVAVTLPCWVPQYVASETNFSAEGVGWICILLAVLVSLRWWIKAFAGIRMLVRTMRFSRRYYRGDGVIAPHAIPVIADPGATLRVALVGLFRPFILIPKSLTEAGGLDPLALDLVLEHERSHAAHHDNWKLLSLHMIPRIQPAVSRGQTWKQLWQNIAERAADEDAVQGSRLRALRLAETLVALARSRSNIPPDLACTQFICPATELASRIEMLTETHENVVSVRSRTLQVQVGVGVLLLTAALVLIGLAPFLTDLPEHILHLG